MKRTTLALLFTFALTGCASPYAGMSPGQFMAMTDYQLCQAAMSYGRDPGTINEINRRGLTCTIETTTCLGYGVPMQSYEMPMCAQRVAETNMADALAFQREQNQYYALNKYGGDSNAQHVFFHGY